MEEGSSEFQSIETSALPWHVSEVHVRPDPSRGPPRRRILCCRRHSDDELITKKLRSNDVVVLEKSDVKSNKFSDIVSVLDTESLTAVMLQRFLLRSTTSLAPPPTPPAPLVKSTKTKDNLTFHVPTPVPGTDIWLGNLAGPHLS